MKRFEEILRLLEQCYIEAKISDNKRFPITAKTHKLSNDLFVILSKLRLLSCDYEVAIKALEK